MKSTDLWKNLPTPAELLENPQVRAMVDRLNPTVVTARVRGFLDEVRSEVSERAEEVGLPTPGELVERVSRYLTGASSQRVSGVINATGRFRGGPLISTPLAESALEQMLLAAQDFSACREESAQGAEADVARLLCERTGAEAAIVLHSHVVAIELALRSLPEPRQVLVARGEVATIEPNSRVTDLAAAAGIALTEVGASDRVTLQDYTDAATEDATLLRLSASDSRAAGEEARPALGELIAAARSADCGVIAELDGAPLSDVEALEGSTGPSIQEAIRLGAQLVLARGDGLVGGPPCGIVVGQADAVERIRQARLAPSLLVDALRAAALSATLRLHSDPSQAQLAVPALSLATVPLDNLRTRAERLAPQIAASAEAADAEVVELSERHSPGIPLCGKSWGIRVTPAGGDPVKLARQLRTKNPSLMASVEQDGLLLDLRTVFPRQDIGLVAAFGQEEAADYADQSDLPPC